MEVLSLEPIELAKKIADVASDKLAIDILLLDTKPACSFADYFVICSGDTERQISAIGDEIEKTLAAEKTHCRKQGAPDSGWVLLDCGDVIVHIFAPRERDYYQLDKLWSKAVPVLRIQ